MATYILGFLFLTAALATVLAFLRLRKLHAEHEALSRTHEELVDRFRPVVDADAERRRVLEGAEAERASVQAETTRLRTEHEQALADLQHQRVQSAAELQSLQVRLDKVRAELRSLDEEANLQSFGFYKPHYDFASSDKYQRRLEVIREQQKAMLKDKTAAICTTEWTVNGSRVEGRKATNQTIKLLLRAFNGECDAAVAKVKYNNVKVMESRIEKAWEAINALGGVQQCSITREYLRLRLNELYLAHEYQEKLQEEKEEQRRIREQMREEEVAQRELEKARQEAENEEKRYAAALAKAQEAAERAAGAKQQKLLADIEELKQRLAEAQSNKQRAIARAQLTRSGHVYVISNIGSFGEHVYKIGMTRRLDPLDRVRELGDASVPFLFDVHAMIWTEDAPALESALHRTFHHRRVNRVNDRKEFFRVTLTEIAEVVRTNHAAEIELVSFAEAAEYRQTLALMVEEPPTPGPARVAETAMA